MNRYGFLFTIPFILLLSCAHKNITGSHLEIKSNKKLFSFGADLSFVPQMQKRGIVYKEDGKPVDIFEIFKKHGCNTIRLKLWHTPQSYVSTWGGDDQSFNDLLQVANLIKKAKGKGLYINLDLHYSDTWADPQKQYIPAAWKNLDLATMRDSVYRYTYSVLSYLEDKGAVPEMIQVGNETNNGMLWPIGEVKENNFASFAQLLNSGIRAVRDFSKHSGIKPKIIIHEAQLQTIDSWMAGITKEGVTDFDIIGLSHYEDWSTVNTMPAITETIRRIKETYKKEVMIVEVGYWWDSKDANGYAISQKSLVGYPFTKEGQYKYLCDFTQAVIDGGGTGVQYWAPDYVGKFGEMSVRSLFDANGNVLPAMDFMLYHYTFLQK